VVELAMTKSRTPKYRAHAKGKLYYSGKDFRTIPVVSQPISLKDGDMLIHFDLSQFTGVTDHQGKDIYEHDIIEVEMYGEKRHWVVAYDPNDNGYPAFDLINWSGESNGISHVLAATDFAVEVVGNIFDDPELAENIKKKIILN